MSPDFHYHSGKRKRSHTVTRLPHKSGMEQSRFPTTLHLNQKVGSQTSPSPQSAMQRRPTDSFGNRGMLETSEAQLRRLDSLPEESRRPQRNGTDLVPPRSSSKAEMHHAYLLHHHTVQCSGLNGPYSHISPYPQHKKTSTLQNEAYSLNKNLTFSPVQKPQSMPKHSEA